MKRSRSKKTSAMDLRASHCYSVDDQTFLKVQLVHALEVKSSLRTLPVARPCTLFEKLVVLDVSPGSSSPRIKEDLTWSFSGNLYDFQLRESMGDDAEFLKAISC
ncbi:hypothetical protein Salat_2905900 [Sesamum alatum]|uniref:Uncharacterized protein n=1 Tax=Sesamum alatum TaxID=300844 RepID=A0AAE1XJI9_9LAMI|nr:hypothetical protein Salat_2905900 [Sesamum alatum]